jgi:hypothetical protein
MQKQKMFACLALFGALSLAPSASSQDRDGDRNRNGGDRVTRIEPGTNISVRTNDSIDVERSDNRVYYGVIEQDVRGQNGSLAIPRGSRVELIVRVRRDNDLVLDLESVNVNGQRYALQTDQTRVESQRDNSLAGTILGAVNGGQVQGRAVRILRDSVLNFRIQTPLVIGVADRGVDRDGNHYHDWYNRENR